MPDSTDPPVKTEPLELAPSPPPAPRPVPTPVRKALRPVPEPPLWLTPEEGGGRRFLAVMVLIGVLGLYAWMLSFYYGGAHPGVDQASYLMTARLIAGEFNPGDPKSVARPNVPAGKQAATAPATAPAIWQGGASGYTDLHPAPAAIQVNPRFDWLRNRLSFVPDSPFEFSSLMNVMTEPFGPASAAKPAEYRYFAKYPFGYSLFAAVGRTIAAHWDKKQMKVAPPVAKEAATVPVIAVEAAAPVSSSAPAVATAKGEAQKSKVATFTPVGQGLDGMYIVNPLCAVLACFFAFFLFRQAVSSFTALIGVLWLATNPIVLAFAHNADSHAPTLMCVCAGFWGLVSFLRTRQVWRGWVGAFALGYACTIRYSEFILVLPVAFAALLHLRLSWKRGRDSLSLLVAWAIPVAVLALVCWVAYGSPTKTGYWYCNEDTGFGWKYLTGAWTDRDMTANWQTLLDQFNRNGLFMIWPLALAGLFGMIGASWRLGGLIACWVLPTLCVYLLYYWAPALGDQISLFYLRFFISIIPGLIFAALWLLERTLQLAYTSQRVALTLAALVPLGLLLVVAFYADGGPRVIDGGLGKLAVGLAEQTPAALAHLFSASWVGLITGVLLLALIPATWYFDQEIMDARIGLALGAGVITALACAINLRTIHQTMEDSFAEQITYRQTVDNLREILPRGTAFFGDSTMLQQLDAVGGWKLYDATALSLYTYNLANAQLAKRNSKEHAEEPFPMQDQRWQFYKELLTSTTPAPEGGSPGPMTQAELMELERAVIEKNMNAGNKMVYVELLDAGDEGRQGQGTSGGNMRSFRLPSGFEKRSLRKWTVSAMPENVVADAATVFGPPRADNAPAATASAPASGPAAPARDAGREGPTFVLWEIVRGAK